MCIAVCYSVLQCVAVLVVGNVTLQASCVLYCVLVCCSVLHCVTACCSVSCRGCHVVGILCVAVCCGV